MNYLAHLALAYPNEDLVVGNFIGDHVRNRDFPRFSPPIQAGIEMHRSIDTFTDSHMVSKTLRQLLFDTHRHMSRVLLDVFYDHFLAVHFLALHRVTLQNFIGLIYPLLENKQQLMPVSAQQYLKGMIAQNWLVKYASIAGISEILSKMARRSGLDDLSLGTESLDRYYEQINDGFLAFYPELIAHANSIKKGAV